VTINAGQHLLRAVLESMPQKIESVFHHVRGLSTASAGSNEPRPGVVAMSSVLDIGERGVRRLPKGSLEPSRSP
jgi:hypothetical protein